MKYKAEQLQTGKFSIFAGRKYFTDFIYETEKEAQQQALIMSHDFYQDQMNSTWEEIKDLLGTNDRGNVKLIGNDYYTNQSDLMC